MFSNKFSYPLGVFRGFSLSPDVLRRILTVSSLVGGKHGNRCTMESQPMCASQGGFYNIFASLGVFAKDVYAFPCLGTPKQVTFPCVFACVRPMRRSHRRRPPAANGAPRRSRTS